MKEIIVKKRFRADTLDIIRKANAIIALYQEQGYSLTLRQLYYQFIARDMFPESWIDEAYNRKNKLAPNTKNTQKNYKRLGTIINDGRMGGEIDWDAISDRTRSLKGLSSWEDSNEIMGMVAKAFRFDKWRNQPIQVQVWVEKDALAEVVGNVCNQYGVHYLACRGYVSQSQMYTAAGLFAHYLDMGCEVYILYLGDHDPSGVDMTRDIRNRLGLFLGDNEGLTVERLALNYDQIRDYNPPPNPAKKSDSRFRDYISKYGRECWELDALEPSVLYRLIERNILMLRDDDLWDELEEEEAYHKGLLVKANENWEAVADFLIKQNGKLK